MIWVATRPDVRGPYIVGWYNNAIVFRSRQHAPEGSGRFHGDEELEYYVSARASDAHLLSGDERTFLIPRGLGGIGQANIWYATDQGVQFRTAVLQFIQDGGRARSNPSLPPRQLDPYRRQLVERSAIELTTAHYRAMGYTVESVETDNVGWDLVARAGGIELKLEVKGLPGSGRTVELTPNEYSKLLEHQTSYRVCIVSNALAETRRLSIFGIAAESGLWENSEGDVLDVFPMTGARLAVSTSRRMKSR